MYKIFAAMILTAVSALVLNGQAIVSHEGHKSEGVVIRGAAGNSALPYDAGTVRLLLSGEQTGGRYSILELKESPGYKTPIHVHRDADEAFYVLEGTLTAEIAGRPYEFTAGSFVLIPRGTPHAQGNFGKTPVRVLLVAVPGGIDQFFQDRAELHRSVKPGHADFEKRITGIIEKHRIGVLGPWEPKP